MTSMLKFGQGFTKAFEMQPKKCRYKPKSFFLNMFDGSCSLKGRTNRTKKLKINPKTGHYVVQVVMMKSKS